MAGSAIPLVVTRLAAGQVRAQVRWWRRHRSEAKYTFEDRLRETYERLQHWPWRGAQALNQGLSGVRRVSVPGVDHWLYYRVALDDTGVPERIEILALWHFRRQNPPELDG